MTEIANTNSSIAPLKNVMLFTELVARVTAR